MNKIFKLSLFFVSICQILHLVECSRNWAYYKCFPIDFFQNNGSLFKIIMDQRTDDTVTLFLYLWDIVVEVLIDTRLPDDKRFLNRSSPSLTMDIAYFEFYRKIRPDNPSDDLKPQLFPDRYKNFYYFYLTKNPEKMKFFTLVHSFFALIKPKTFLFCFFFDLDLFSGKTPQVVGIQVGMYHFYEI